MKNKKKNLKIKERKTLILQSEKIDFKDLLLKLCVHSKGNSLSNVLVRDCHIINFPKDLVMYNKFKYKGRWISLFCGFFCGENIAIIGNFFTSKNKFPKKKK